MALNPPEKFEEYAGLWNEMMAELGDHFELDLELPVLLETDAYEAARLINKALAQLWCAAFGSVTPVRADRSDPHAFTLTHLRAGQRGRGPHTTLCKQAITLDFCDKGNWWTDSRSEVTCKDCKKQLRHSSEAD